LKVKEEKEVSVNLKLNIFGLKSLSNVKIEKGTLNLP